MPFIHNQEVGSIKEQIKGKQVLVIFDGTTHVCEALIILVDEEFDIKQRVVRHMLLAKSLTGEEVAHQLIVCLSTELGIAPDKLLACMRDRASVNNVGVKNCLP